MTKFRDMVAPGRIETWIKDDGSIMVASTGTKNSLAAKQRLWKAGEYGLIEGSTIHAVNGSFPIQLSNGRWRLER